MQPSAINHHRKPTPPPSHPPNWPVHPPPPPCNTHTHTHWRSDLPCHSITRPAPSAPSANALVTSGTCPSPAEQPALAVAMLPAHALLQPCVRPARLCTPQAAGNCTTGSGQMHTPLQQDQGAACGWMGGASGGVVRACVVKKGLHCHTSHVTGAAISLVVAWDMGCVMRGDSHLAAPVNESPEAQRRHCSREECYQHAWQYAALCKQVALETL